jgi:hypothetical protein
MVDQLTADKQRPCRPNAGGVTTRRLGLAGYTVMTAVHSVYKGSWVICDINVSTTGYFRAAKSATTAGATGDIIGGISLEHKYVGASDLAEGSQYVTVAVDGVWGFPINSLTQADIGKAIYTTDDGNTISATSGTAYWVGTLVDVDATYAWIDIGRACGRLNAAT